MKLLIINFSLASGHFILLRSNEEHGENQMSFRENTLPSKAKTQVRSQAWCYWVCDGGSGIGVDFLQVLGFHLLILNPSTVPRSSLIRGYSDRRTKWT